MHTHRLANRLPTLAAKITWNDGYSGSSQQANKKETTVDAKFIVIDAADSA